MVEIRDKFRKTMADKKWDVARAARELGVCRASFYNYLKAYNADLPSMEVLKRAHDLWGLNFTNIDFGAPGKSTSPSETEQPRQYVLPFIQSVREQDIEIVKTKSVKPDTLQLIVNIRFAG